MDVEARLGLLMQGFKVRVDCVLGPGPEGLLQQRREVVQLVREVGEPEHGDNIMYYQKNLFEKIVHAKKDFFAFFQIKENTLKNIIFSKNDVLIRL